MSESKNVLFDNYWNKPAQIDKVSDFSIAVFFKADIWHFGQYHFKDRVWCDIPMSTDLRGNIPDDKVICWMIPPDSPEKKDETKRSRYPNAILQPQGVDIRTSMTSCGILSVWLDTFGPWEKTGFVNYESLDNSSKIRVCERQALSWMVSARDANGEASSSVFIDNAIEWLKLSENLHGK